MNVVGKQKNITLEMTMTKCRILEHGSLIWEGRSVDICGMRARELECAGKKITTEMRENGGPWRPVRI